MVQNEQSGFEVPEDTPEYYVDSAHVNTQLYGSTLLLGELREGETPKIKVSPQMAKVLSLILSKHVREYERDVGAINIPKPLYHQLGLEEMI